MENRKCTCNRHKNSLVGTWEKLRDAGHFEKPWHGTRGAGREMADRVTEVGVGTMRKCCTILRIPEKDMLGVHKNETDRCGPEREVDGKSSRVCDTRAMGTTRRR